MLGGEGLGVEWWRSLPQEGSKAHVVGNTVTTGHGSTQKSSVSFMAIFHLSTRLHDSG